MAQPDDGEAMTDLDSLLKWVDQIADKFDAEWQAALHGSPRPRIEDYTTSTDEPRRTELLRELISVDVDYRLSQDDVPTAQDYLSRFGFLDQEWLQRVVTPVRRSQFNELPPGEADAALVGVGSAVVTKDIQQPLNSWPSSGPRLVETFGETQLESDQPKSRYTWLSEVGQGGLGRVWLARDNDLVRDVALKEVQPGKDSNEAVRRLIKEAQITGQLQHPNIVPVYEVNRGTRPFYTMKLVRGETLLKAIQQHHARRRSGQEDLLSGPRLMNVFLNVCDALAYAHSRGVIHRDLKPENIVLGDYGEAIVLDWGLARQLNYQGEEPRRVVVTGDAETDATQAGRLIGTVKYMAPEQALGRVGLMDERTDIYGLGAILFEILTGEPPHPAMMLSKGKSSLNNDATDPVVTGQISPACQNDGVPSTHHSEENTQRPDSLAARLRHIATGKTPQVRELDPGIHEELDAICSKAMAKSRDERYQTAKDLKVALLEFQVHKESIDLAATAAEDFDHAKRTRQYADYNRAIFGFEEALRQWPANTRAARGIKEARMDYSQAAFEHGEYDLALSVLDPDDNEYWEARTNLFKARNLRTARLRRGKWLKAIVVLLILVLVIGAAALFRVKVQRDALRVLDAVLLAEELRPQVEGATHEIIESLANANIPRINAGDTQQKAEETTVKALRNLIVWTETARQESRKAKYLGGLLIVHNFLHAGRYSEAHKKMLDVQKEYSDLCGDEWIELQNLLKQGGQ